MVMLSRYSLLPLTSRLRAKLSGTQAIWSGAAEKIQLAPADESSGFPVICLPNELDRVIDVAPLSTFALERSYVAEAPISQGPTIGYRFENAILADNTLYAAGRFEVARAGEKRSFWGNTMSTAQLCAHSPSNIYFGHWLRDALAMELLAEQRGLKGLSYVRKPWLHEPGYREIMKLPARPMAFARVRNLWSVDDRGLNASWIKRFRELRARVRKAAAGGGPARVFLARGRGGESRELVNAPAIYEVLAARGFVSRSRPESLSPQQIVNTLSAAKIAISVEGSACTQSCSIFASKQFSSPGDPAARSLYGIP